MTRWYFLTTMLMLLCSCGQMPTHRFEFNAQWHRQQLLEGHLSRWLTAGSTSSGLFIIDVNRQWHAVSQEGSLTGQSRLIYAMASGYELTRDRRYLEAAVRGTQFLLEHFYDIEHGGFFDRVDIDGSTVSDVKRSYGHAFALFALAHMYRVTLEAHYRTAAFEAWHDIEKHLRDQQGGLVSESSRQFIVRGAGRTLDPLMHMFEALLALSDATHATEVLVAANSLGRFVLERLLRTLPDGSAYIPEQYGNDWQPLTNNIKGEEINIGHQFEWTHLFLKAESLGLGNRYASVASQVLQYALRVGYDATEGGAFYIAYPDGTLERDKYWWQQAECVRALLAAALSTGRPDLWRRYEQTLAFIQRAFIDPAGGWWFATTATCRHAQCPDVQPDPYHITGMHLAAMQADEAFHRYRLGNIEPAGR